MAEKGRPATDDVVAIRPGGEMVDPRKIIPGEEFSPPQTDTRDDTKSIRQELEKRAQEAAETPTVPAENRTTLHGSGETSTNGDHLKTHGIAYTPRNKK